VRERLCVIVCERECVIVCVRVPLCVRTQMCVHAHGGVCVSVSVCRVLWVASKALLPPHRLPADPKEHADDRPRGHSELGPPCDVGDAQGFMATQNGSGWR